MLGLNVNFLLLALAFAAIGFVRILSGTLGDPYKNPAFREIAIFVIIAFLSYRMFLIDGKPLDTGQKILAVVGSYSVYLLIRLVIGAVRTLRKK